MPPAVGSGCWASDRGYGARREAIERRAMRPPPRDFTDDERTQAVSHTADAPGAAGVLVLHGFTGNPSSMRGRGRGVRGRPTTTSRCPACPGHGTTIDDMLHHRLGRLGRRGRRRLPPTRRARRARRVVGRRMGGSLALSTALGHPEVAGLVLVNPATRAAGRRRSATMLLETLEAGTEVVPRHRQRHRRPGNEERNYEGTPLRPLLSLLDDGLVPMSIALRRADDAAAAVHVAPGPRRRPGRQRAPRRRVRRPGRPPLARAQLPRRHAGLRPRRHHRRRPRVRQAGHGS